MCVNESMFKGPNFASGLNTGQTVYIAGAISGDLVGNLPRFFEAEEALRNAGHSTCNPARSDGGRTAQECVDRALAAIQHQPWKDWTYYMRKGIQGLMRCNTIALLPGWQNSRGARVEAGLALTLGYAKVHHETGELLRAQCSPGEPMPPLVPKP